MFGGSALVLEGLRVLDLSDGVAGQFAARILAEHGADVQLIEPPAGTATRHPGSVADRYLFDHLNSGKRSAVLDLDQSVDRDRLALLTADADVLISDTHDLSELQARNQRLIACSIGDFHPGGPYGRWTGSELIHQALSGLMFATGRADSEPLYGFGHRASYATGAAAVSAIVGALLIRARTGRGQLLEVYIHETAAAMSQNQVAQFSYNGSFMRRGPYPGPCDLFKCNDGWVSMFCNSGRWSACCTALGHEEMLADPRFASVVAAMRHWDEAAAIFASTASRMSSTDFIAACEKARCLASRVLGIDEILACEHQAARGFWESVPDEDGRPRPILGPMFRMSRTPRRVDAAAPPLADARQDSKGQHASA